MLTKTGSSEREVLPSLEQTVDWQNLRKTIFKLTWKEWLFTIGIYFMNFPTLDAFLCDSCGCLNKDHLLGSKAFSS